MRSMLNIRVDLSDQPSDAAVGVGAPVFFCRSLKPVTVLYGLGNVIITGAIFQPDGIVVPSDDGRMLTMFEVSDTMDMPDVQLPCFLQMV